MKNLKFIDLFAGIGGFHLAQKGKVKWLGSFYPIKYRRKGCFRSRSFSKYEHKKEKLNGSIFFIRILKIL